MNNNWGRLAVRLLIGLLIGLNGCLEHSVKTTVAGDGSCQRTIAVTADSGRVPETRMPLPSDTSWTIRWEKREGKSEFSWTALKRYDDLTGLAGEQARLNQTGKIRIDIEAGRSFRWFYTYYRYRETYHRFTPLNRVPPQDVMTDDEIRRFTAGEGGDTLDLKVQEWKNRNYVDFFLHALDTLLAAEPAPALPPAQVRTAWGPMMRLLSEGREIEETLASQVPGATKKEMFRDSTMALSAKGVEAMRRIFVKALGTNAGRFLPVERAWDDAVRYALQTSTEEAGGDFENIIVLPGLFLDTNGGSLKGNTARWSFKHDQIELADYVMEAESRVVNTGPFIVSGIVVLGFLALIFIPLFRSRSGIARL